MGETLFTESWDTGDLAGAQNSWDSDFGNATLVTGRTNMGFAFNSGCRSITKFVPFNQSITIGWAVKMGVQSNQSVLSTNLFDLRTLSDGSFGFGSDSGGAVVIDGVTHTLKHGIRTRKFAWVEVQCKASTTTTSADGLFRVYVNERPIFEATGINLKGTQQHGLVNFSDEQFSSIIDDIYLRSGSDIGDMLGNSKILTTRPNADGHYGDFSIFGASTRWQAVSETNPDADASYIFTDVDGDICTSELSALPIGLGEIRTITYKGIWRASDAGGCTAAPVLYDPTAPDEPTGTTIGVTVAPMTDYVTTHQSFDTDPVTGVAWTETTLGTLEIGTKRIGS